MKLLLSFYPRRWRARYGDELAALLEAEPLTWRARLDVAGAGLHERLRNAGRPQSSMLWAWSLFVVGGMTFQKASEHWQTVVGAADRSVPTAAFDVLQAAAAVGSAAVLAGVALALPAFVRDLRRGGWPAVRSPILVASAATAVAATALIALAAGRGVVAASVFVAAAVVSLFAWTHAAARAAERLEPTRVHAYLARTVAAAMALGAVAAAVWLAAVPSFVGAAQLALMSTFMLAGTALGLRSLRA